MRTQSTCQKKMICLHQAFDDRAPEAILGRKPLVIDLLEGLEILVQQPPQVGGLGVTGAVQRQRGKCSQSFTSEDVYRCEMDMT
jgi:hypothetical protein